MFWGWCKGSRATVLGAVGVSLSQPLGQLYRRNVTGAGEGHHCEYNASPALWEPPFHKCSVSFCRFVLTTKRKHWLRWFLALLCPPRLGKGNTVRRERCLYSASVSRNFAGGHFLECLSSGCVCLLQPSRLPCLYPQQGNADHLANSFRSHDLFP